MFIDLLTLTTGNPVCFATRSAVRWRVPCSSVGIEGSGSSCTAARSSLVASRSQMPAPSLFASARSRCAEKSTSRENPPEAIASTVRSCPRTTSPPVRPRRMRSRPSRSTVPGATWAMAVRSSASTSVVLEPATVPPGSACVTGDAVRSSYGDSDARCRGRVPCDGSLLRRDGQTSTAARCRSSPSASSRWATSLMRGPSPTAWRVSGLGSRDTDPRGTRILR